MPRYCDVSLPVPLDQAFTYSLPLTLQHRVKAGARVVVPFGTRKLTGVALSVHDDPPGVAMKDVFRLIDNEPVLSDELLSLGRWISVYYCAPLHVTARRRTAKRPGITPASMQFRLRADGLAYWLYPPVC